MLRCLFFQLVLYVCCLYLFEYERLVCFCCVGFILFLSVRKIGLAKQDDAWQNMAHVVS